MLASTRPPATCTTGSEIPKNSSRPVPTNSITSMKMVVLIAILRARSRNTDSGASPTKPKNTNADPRGLTSGQERAEAQVRRT